MRWAKPTILAMLIVLGVSCGPRGPVQEPPGEPDDTKPGVVAAVDFLETSPIPPEVMDAIEKQRQKVVPRPEPLGEITYQFPQVKKGTLENGMDWYLVNEPGLPVVSLNLVMRAGMAHEPQDLPGLSVFTGDMLREGGSTQHSSAQLADAIEKMGAQLTILTGADYTMVAIDGLSEEADALTGLMAEMVTQPAFGQEDIDAFKKREQHRLTLNLSEPEWMADRVLMRHLYGDHPYSHYDTTLEALEKLTRDDIVAFYEKHYVAKNSFFVVVGDMSEDRVQDVLESTVGEMPKGKAVKMKWPAPPQRQEPEVVIVDRPGSAQTVIRVGNISMKGDDPDLVPFKVTNHVLGGNASSRLFMTLREDRGLTYGCYSNAAMRVDLGTFFVETSTKTQSTVEAVDAIFQEMEKLTAEDPDQGGLTDEELQSYQNYLAGVLPIKAQSFSRIADLLIDQKVYGLPDDYYDTYAGDVRSVTVDTVIEMAGKYIHPDQAVIVLVGDAAAFREQAGKWGSVTEDQP